MTPDEIARGLTGAQRAAFKWLKEHGGDACFDKHGVAFAQAGIRRCFLLRTEEQPDIYCSEGRRRLIPLLEDQMNDYQHWSKDEATPPPSFNLIAFAICVFTLVWFS